MRRLWHWPLDPGCRTVRLALEEKKIAFDAKVTWPGATISELANLAPGSDLPVFLDAAGEQKIIASGTHAILEYIEDTDAAPRLMPLLIGCWPGTAPKCAASGSGARRPSPK